MNDQFQKKEKSLRSKKTALEEVEGSFTARLQDLDRRLVETETLLSTHEDEILSLKTDAEKKVSTLRGQLQEREESLRAKESAVKKMEESLATMLQDLGRRLVEKETLLITREAEIKDLRSKQVGINTFSNEQVILQEKDELTHCKLEEEQGEETPMVMAGDKVEKLNEQMVEDIQKLTSELQKNELMLSASEKEVSLLDESEEKGKESGGFVRRKPLEEQKQSRLVSVFHIGSNGNK